MDKTIDTIGGRLRDARQRLSLSARALAGKAEVATALVGMIERGDVKNPRGQTLEKLARALGVSMHWLVTGRDENVAGAAE